MVVNYEEGGATKPGASEVLPLQKGGQTGNVSAMLKGGGQKKEIVLTRELEVLAMLKGGAKSNHYLKGGRAQKV